MTLISEKKEEEEELRLSIRICADILCGCGAGLGVAPWVTTVDKSIFQNASGALPMKESIKQSLTEIFTKPHRFARRPEFLMILGLYSATYIAANTIDTYCEVNNISKAMPKFIGVSATNISLCVLKDRAFARLFGVISPTAVPLTSLALWCLRDMATIFTSFNIPPLLSEYLYKNQYFKKKETAYNVSQLLAPITVQLFSTPLHLLGMDLYNHRVSTVGKRVSFIKREYGKTAAARIGRIFPAYSLGGLGNKWLHEYLYVLALSFQVKYAPNKKKTLK